MRTDNYKSSKYLPMSICSSPGFTSGRGATLTDLNSESIEFIYEEIVKNQSQEAGDAFVEMVVNLEVASCTDFLLSLYALETNEWKFETKNLPKDKGVYVENEGEAIGTILSALGGSTRNETLQIVMPFLSKFNKKHISLGKLTRHGNAFVDYDGIYYNNSYGR